MIIAEKAPVGIMTSDVYEVKLTQGDVCETSSVYLTLCPHSINCHNRISEEMKVEFNGITDGGGEATLFDKAYFTGFTTDAETRVTVKINQAFEKIDVIGKEFEVDGDVVTFSMCPGEKTVVMVGDDFGKHLTISADREYEIPTDAENLVELKPGFYTAENCEYITLNTYGAPVFSVPNNTVVYFHRSAVVNAAILLENKHNIKIMGSGIVSTVDRCYGADKGFNVEPNYAPLRKGAVPSVYIKTNSSDISVEGITLSCEFRGVTVRNSKNIVIDNVKAFTSSINADAINMMNVVNMLVNDCLTISTDDSIAVFTNCDSILFLDDPECENPVHYSANIEVKNSILITGARIFCLGGHSAGGMDPRDLFENFYAHDIKGFRIGGAAVTEKHAMYWSGPLRIISQTEQYVRNIKIENVTIKQHHKYNGKLIHIQVRSDAEASYTETNGYRVENVELSNIDFVANGEIIVPSLIKSQSDITEEGYCIDGVHLKNIRIAGKMLENTPAFLNVAGPVKNLTVE